MAAVNRSARKASGAGRIRMFWLVVLRALTTRGSRIGIALGAIIVGSAVISALSSLYFDISIKMSEELRAFGANVVITPRTAEAGSGGQHAVNAATLAAATEALPAGKLVGASPFLYGVARLDLGDAVVVGVNFPGLKAISPYWQVEGSWVSADFDERNTMIGRRLAQTMQLKVGSPVKIVAPGGGFQVNLRVRGIVDTGGAEDDQVFVNLSLAQKLFSRPGGADLAMASVIAQGAEADRLTALISSQVPAIEARAIRKISQSDGKILEKIEGLMAFVAAIILVITTLCVNATLTAMVQARTRQIGLQKAIGASNASIVVQFVAETAVICLVAVTVGLGLGFALAQGLGQAVFGGWVTFRAQVLPLTFGLSLVAALVAAVLPVRGAVRIVPARVLRGE